MSDTVIKVEKLSKAYRLGQIGTGTLTNDLRVWWHTRLLKRPNPMLKIGQVDHGNRAGETIWALKDVSFDVQQGEVLGIIGRNGAGKSTLLKILSRVTAPTSGCVNVKGRIASLLEVGTGFHPELTGRENIYLNGAILGMTREEVKRKFDEIVAFTEIEQFVDTPVKRYSSGMYVRLAFAVAAHLESEILLVDEVLAVGDAEFQKKCLGKMGDVASKEGRTVLFVSHNMGAVRNLCPESILLHKGSIEFSGESFIVIKKYAESAQCNDKYAIASEVDCAEYPHSGSGEAKIIHAKIFNSRGDLTNDFDMDEEIHLEFTIDNPHELQLNHAIEIIDQNDYPLFQLMSEYEPIKELRKNALKKIIIVRVVIPPLLIFPDNYFINLWTGLHYSRVDKVEKCLNIRINKSANIRRELLTTRGRIYKEGIWSIYRGS